MPQPRQIQFRLTAEQLSALAVAAPKNMSVNQAAKMMVLQRVDPGIASMMEQRAAAGFQRLTYVRP